MKQGKEAKRGSAYRRYVRNKTIQRKKRISKAVYGIDWYRQDGKYSKGKIHCGCGLCKPGKKYGLPTARDMRDKTKENINRRSWEAEPQYGVK